MGTGGAVADIVELILSDHRRIRRLQEVLRTAAGRCGSEPSWVLPRTWDRLAGLIILHISAKEEVCWLPMSTAAPEIRPHIRGMTMSGEDTREAIAGAGWHPPGRSGGGWRSTTRWPSATRASTASNTTSSLVSCASPTGKYVTAWAVSGG
jgi:hypothetical protein